MTPTNEDRRTKEGKSPWGPFVVWLAFLGLMIITVALLRVDGGSDATRVDYSTFYDMVEKGEVASVTLRGQDGSGELKTPRDLGGTLGRAFHVTIPQEDDSLLPLMRDKHVRVEIQRSESEAFPSIVLTVLPWLLVMGAWLWFSFSRGGVRMPLRGIGAFAASRAHRFERSAQVNVTFDDVAGLANAKRDLREVVDYLKAPGEFGRLGCKAPRGVLLVGPPGTGKTLLARAVAGESSVPFFSISASEFIEMFVGVGAARVRDLFEQAKKEAPAIVFIDELDAVGRSRGTGFGGGHDEREQTLNQLLSEMDGFTRNDLIVVLAATNRPDVLDPALLRPGRFDRRVLVDRPELDARRSILQVHTRKVPLAEDVDLDGIARNTPGFSGADLANLVNEAALTATRRGVLAIEESDFSAAFDKVLLGDPREGKLDAKEKRRVAVHECGHAVVAHFAAEAERPRRISIIPRGMALGATQQTPGSDRHVLAKPELEARLCVLLGGYAAEQLVLEGVSTGAENDLKEATHLATKMVANYGMSSTLGPVHYEHELEHPFLGQRVATAGGASDATIAVIEQETRSVLTSALGVATALIKGHLDAFERLVARVLEKETLEQGELEAVLTGRAPASSDKSLAAE